WSSDVCSSELDQLGRSRFPQALLLLDGYVAGRVSGGATRLPGAGDRELGEDKHERESLSAARCVAVARPSGLNNAWSLRPRTDSMGHIVRRRGSGRPLGWKVARTRPPLSDSRIGGRDGKI